MTESVNIKKLKKQAIIPTYGSADAAGADLYACMEQPVTILSGETAFIGTGLAVAIPKGYVGLIYARSGLACKQGVAPANKVGVIDADYRGELIVALHNHSAQPVVIEPEQRIAQLVLTPYLTADFRETEELDATDRGDHGFGSTGSK